MIQYDILATGSTGNCTLLERKIMVDCGVPYKTVAPYMDSIKLVLITHEHGDHFRPSTIRRMALERPLLRFGCGPWMAKKLRDAGVAKSQLDVMREKVAYNYGICNIIPVPVYHDVQNYGYKIHFSKGKVFYCTDMGNLDGIKARAYDLYLVENNYKDEELQMRLDEKIANGEYPYEQRVLRYHMSEKQITDWLYSNMDLQKSTYVFLHAHVDRTEKQE